MNANLQQDVARSAFLETDAVMRTSALLCIRNVCKLTFVHGRSCRVRQRPVLPRVVGVRHAHVPRLHDGQVPRRAAAQCRGNLRGVDVLGQGAEVIAAQHVEFGAGFRVNPAVRVGVRLNAGKRRCFGVLPQRNDFPQRPKQHSSVYDEKVPQSLGVVIGIDVDGGSEEGQPDTRRASAQPGDVKYYGLLVHGGGRGT